MSKNYLFPALILFLLFSSCGSYQKVPYFQDLNRSSTENITNFTSLTIQPEDILSINVNSLNPGAWQDSTSKAEYLVNEEGTVQVPLIGEVKVAGSTVSAVEKQLHQQLTRYLKNPTVNVRVMNFKVAVFGDVTHPDVFKISNSKVTFLEALSLAGDLNITAMRTNVLLIREVNGKREFKNIDLTTSNIFNSTSYYLKNNDVIYVQPGKTKYAAVDNRGYQTVSLVLSALSIIAIVLTNIKK